MNKINLNLFGFSFYVIISDYIISRGLRNENAILLFIILLIFFSYDIVIIIKLILSYAIIKSKITWFMSCDYVLIILISLHLGLLLFIFNGLVYENRQIESSRKKDILFLTKFK